LLVEKGKKEERLRGQFSPKQWRRVAETGGRRGLFGRTMHQAGGRRGAATGTSIQGGRDGVQGVSSLPFHSRKSQRGRPPTIFGEDALMYAGKKKTTERAKPKGENTRGRGE